LVCSYRAAAAERGAASIRVNRLANRRNDVFSLMVIQPMTDRPPPPPISGVIQLPKNKVPRENRRPKVALPAQSNVQLEAQRYEKQLSHSHQTHEYSDKTLSFDQAAQALAVKYGNGGPTALADFDAAVRKLVRDTATSFIFPENRAAFERDYSGLILAHRVHLRSGNAAALMSINDQHRAKARDYYAERARNAKTPYEREDALERGLAAINNAERARLVGAKKAEAERSDFRLRADPDGWKAMSRSIRGGIPSLDGALGQARSYQAEQSTDPIGSIVDSPSRGPVEASYDDRSRNPDDDGYFEYSDEPRPFQWLQWAFEKEFSGRGREPDVARIARNGETVQVTDDLGVIEAKVPEAIRAFRNRIIEDLYGKGTVLADLPDRQNALEWIMKWSSFHSYMNTTTIRVSGLKKEDVIAALRRRPEPDFVYGPTDAGQMIRLRFTRWGKGMEFSENGTNTEGQVCLVT
jgi:hypothetical protein